MQFKKHTALKQVCVCGVFIAISIIGSNLLFRRQHTQETGNPPLISKSAYKLSLTGIREEVAFADKSSTTQIDGKNPSIHKSKWLVEQSTTSIFPTCAITHSYASLNRLLSIYSRIIRPGYYLSLFRYALF